MDITPYFKHYRPGTQDHYQRSWEEFETWLLDQGRTLQEVTHETILDYVRYRRTQGVSVGSMNKELSVLDRVLEQALLGANPVRGFRIKGVEKKPLQEPLEVAKLAALVWAEEDAELQLAMSLLHYQALRSGELLALRSSGVDLAQGRLWVAAQQRSEGRYVPLVARQIPLLQAQLAKRSGAELLLGWSQVQSRYARIKRRALGAGIALKNWEHWRSSVIVGWLSKEPLLVVQKRLGHRYASSTERYQLRSIEQLGKALHQHHPLRE